MATPTTTTPQEPTISIHNNKQKPKRQFTYPDRDDFKSGYLTSLTTQQNNVFGEFKLQLKQTEYWSDVEKNPDGDRFLLRFLRATMKDKHTTRIFQLKPAMERITGTLKFRQQYHADEIRTSLEKKEPLSDEYVRYRDQIRPRLQFIDRKTGRLVHVERFGVMSSYLDTKHFDTEKWIEMFIRDCESTLLVLREESIRRGYEISTQISIMDQAYSGMGVVRRMSLFKIMNNVAAEHYPELLGPIFLVNCPWIFASVFSIIKPMIDVDTASKLIVEHGIPKDILSDFLSVEDLPVEYGGNRDVVVGYCCDFSAA
jgi:hypothetical protein